MLAYLSAETEYRIERSYSHEEMSSADFDYAFWLELALDVQMS